MCEYSHNSIYGTVLFQKQICQNDVLANKFVSLRKMIESSISLLIANVGA